MRAGMVSIIAMDIIAKFALAKLARIDGRPSDPPIAPLR
jgi:hypothetical protein